MTRGDRPDSLESIEGLQFPKPDSYDHRYTSVVTYDHLREMIITGVLPPGTELKQSVLAKEFGVSRTPLREATRRLQSEGLITLEVNQRAIVSGLDVSEIDALYGIRIALEAHGLRVSTGRLSAKEVRTARTFLNEMWQAGKRMDLRGWTSAHLRFHEALVVEAGSHSASAMMRLAQECDRYLFFYHRTRPRAPQSRHQEHVELLAAVQGDDVELSGRLVAQHLATTAIDLIHDLDPRRGVTAIKSALELVDPGGGCAWLEAHTESASI